MRDDLIYDVGMHAGEDTEFYLRKGFRVVGIEANAQLCEECAHKFSQLFGSVIKNHQQGDQSYCQTIDFFLNEQVSIWGTANPEWVKRNKARGLESHPVKVEATSIKDVILKFGVPYYMKVDIEGMDSVCLEGLLSVEREAKVYFGGGKRDVDQEHVHATASARSAGIHEIQDCPTTQYF